MACPNQALRHSDFYVLIHILRGRIVKVPGWMTRCVSAVGRMLMMYIFVLVVLVATLFPVVMVALPFFLYIVPFILMCLVISAFADWVQHRPRTGTH